MDRLRLNYFIDFLPYVIQSLVFFNILAFLRIFIWFIID
jgi:hypothetical protein